jgi:DNA polymerase III epsilon subunit-like protein
MKMLSLDVETTGLNPKVHGIIQIGAVLFDSHAPVGTVEKSIEMNLMFDNLVWSTFCLNMHKDWIARWHLDAAGLYRRDQAISWMFQYLSVGQRHLTIAAKNPNFDVLFLQALPDPKMCLSDRIIYTHDPYHYYVLPEDKYPPSLKNCKTRAIDRGCTAFESIETAHTGLADAIDIVILTQFAASRGKL